MALDSYDGLKAEIANYAFRTGDAEFEAAVPSFIRLAETRIGRALRVSDMEETVSLSLTNGAGYLPNDFLEARRVISGAPSVDLAFLAPSAATDLYPTNYGGIARHYSTVGGRLQTYPSGTGPVTIIFYAAIPALSEDNQSNWLLEKAPDLYLYGSLVEAAPFMMDDAGLQKWMTLYRAALNDVQNADKMARWAGARARTVGPTP